MSWFCLPYVVVTQCRSFAHVLLNTSYIIITVFGQVVRLHFLFNLSMLWNFKLASLILIAGLGHSSEESESLLREKQEEVLSCFRGPIDQWHLSRVHTRSWAKTCSHPTLFSPCEVCHADVGPWPGRAGETAAEDQLHWPGWGEWQVNPVVFSWVLGLGWSMDHPWMPFYVLVDLWKNYILTELKYDI